MTAPHAPRRGLLYAGIGLLAAGLFAALLLTPGGNGGPRIGAAAPDFRLMDLSGNPVRLSEQRGQAVLIDFWATWCATCVESLPEMAELHEKFRGRDFLILAVSMDEGSPESVASFAAERRLPYRILFADAAVADDYRVSGLPAQYLVDRDGIITQSYLSDTDFAKLSEDIAALLDRRTP
ncbi:MAG: hypothetical protein A2X36_06835 [Elusimicrobia bacterium GWA2_69_24]|nr:MAG: hypothetical protein A2X36_06835 [Elusimicrobia bacterium GWA2_69_24]